ncbi:MAG: 50S ribosomal protein L25 [Psittacicella sp.]
MFTLEATLRESLGKGSSRRARNEGLVPAVIYGKNEAPVSILLDHNKVIFVTDKEEFYTATVTIKIGSKEETVKIQAIQRHPFKPKFLHLDFLRV